MKLTITLLCLLFLQIITVQNVKAEIALEFTALDGGEERSDGSYSQGWRFTANSAIQVTSLGYFNGINSAMTVPHEVGIYEQATCTLVVSGTVSPTDTLDGVFRYIAITPVMLEAGKEYYIAGVTHTDKYALNVGNLIIDPAITFWGYAQYGFVTNTQTLQCPNGIGSQNYRGDFGPTFKFGNNTGTSKRATAATIFCNRTGPDLLTANCSATVSDKGAAIRTSPTGTVSFIAKDGLTPASASCSLQQTSFSPGVSSCQAQFQLPVGFGIGKAFPIDVTYGGSDTFQPSSSAHGLIYATCVGTAQKPCPSSVTLSFGDSPKIVNKAITMEATCGSQPATSSVKTREIPIGIVPGGSCKILSGLGLDVEALLKQASQIELINLSDAYKEATSSNKKISEAMFKYAEQASQLKAGDYLKLQQNQALIDEITKAIEKNSKNTDFMELFSRRLILNPAKSTGSSKTKKQSLIRFATQDQEIKPDKVKNIKFKLNKRMLDLVTIFKEAEISTLPLKSTMSVKQQKRSGKATLTQSVDLIL